MDVSAMKRVFTVIMAGVVLSTVVTVFVPATTAGAACYTNNDNERSFASKLNARSRERTIAAVEAQELSGLASGVAYWEGVVDVERASR